MSYRLLAIDTGGDIGYAYATDSRIQVRGEIPEGEYHEFWRLIGTLDPHAIVCELFENIGNSAADLGPVRCEGIVCLWQRQRARPVHWQRATEVKPFWTDDKLKALKLYMPGKRHANDATRHILNFITFNQEDQRYLMALRPALHTQ